MVPTLYYITFTDLINLLCLSLQLGMLGLLERENAAILNESLKPLASDTITAFRVALNKLGFNCPFSLTQNDGTLIRSVPLITSTPLEKE